MDVSLRRATPADLPRLRHWDTQPHVIAATGGDGGFEWEKELPRDVDWRELLIAEAGGRPIGFMQIIDAAREETHYWGDAAPNLRAIDIWIGEPADLGRGYGTQMMRLAIARCFSDPAVTAILIDPLAANTRARRFYERLGFVAVERRMFGDDDCVVYRLERAAANRTLNLPLKAVLAGRVAPLGDDGATSGIDKHPVAEPVWLGREGLNGDAQADRRVHGGPEKALHHYPFDHYAGWRADIGGNALLNRPGAFGENVSTEGLTEASVCVGDVFRIGSARIQVSQARQPCWKLNRRFAVADMARRVQTSRRTGWYYRVLEEGMVAPGDSLMLEERLAPDWSIARLLHVFYVDMLNRDELREIADLDALAGKWRDYARRRLKNGEVEDWSRRLRGSPAGS